MSLSKCSNKIFSESEQAVYSSHLKFIIENVVNYNDLNSIKSTIRTDVLQFLQIEIGQMKFVVKKREEKNDHDRRIFVGIPIIFL